MSLIVPLELTGLTKVFPTEAGPFVAVKNVNVRIQKSEFICIVGQSGCGKSTVLSIIAGLQRATEGGVVINGKQTLEPGADRAVVFQTPSLLPWLTARQNVELAVKQKFRALKASERRAHALKYLALTGVADAAVLGAQLRHIGTGHGHGDYGCGRRVVEEGQARPFAHQLAAAELHQVGGGLGLDESNSEHGGPLVWPC